MSRQPNPFIPQTSTTTTTTTTTLPSQQPPPPPPQLAPTTSHIHTHTHDHEKDKVKSVRECVCLASNPACRKQILNKSPLGNAATFRIQLGLRRFEAVARLRKCAEYSKNQERVFIKGDAVDVLMSFDPAAYTGNAWLVVTKKKSGARRLWKKRWPEVRDKLAPGPGITVMQELAVSAVGYVDEDNSWPQTHTLGRATECWCVSVYDDPQLPLWVDKTLIPLANNNNNAAAAAVKLTQENNCSAGSDGGAITTITTTTVLQKQELKQQQQQQKQQEKLLPLPLPSQSPLHTPSSALATPMTTAAAQLLLSLSSFSLQQGGNDGGEDLLPSDGSGSASSGNGDNCGRGGGSGDDNNCKNDCDEVVVKIR